MCEEEREKKLSSLTVQREADSITSWNPETSFRNLWCCHELERRHLEGMVAKRSASVYVGGRTRDWLKIKTSAVIDEMLKRSPGLESIVA